MSRAPDTAAATREARDTPVDPGALWLVIRRARSLAGIAAFVLAAYLAVEAGHDAAGAGARGLIAGAVSALAVWAVALACASIVSREAQRPSGGS